MNVNFTINVLWEAHRTLHFRCFPSQCVFAAHMPSKFPAGAATNQPGFYSFIACFSIQPSGLWPNFIFVSLAMSCALISSFLNSYDADPGVVLTLKVYHGSGPAHLPCFCTRSLQWWLQHALGIFSSHQLPAHCPVCSTSLHTHKHTPYIAASANISDALDEMLQKKVFHSLKYFKCKWGH